MHSDELTLNRIFPGSLPVLAICIGYESFFFYDSRMQKQFDMALEQGTASLVALNSDVSLVGRALATAALWRTLPRWSGLGQLLGLGPGLWLLDHFGRAFGTPLARLRILDLSCGFGLPSEPLARRGAQGVGSATFARGPDTDQRR